jgi:DNA-binding NarL/FixJ family response regulator
MEPVYRQQEDPTMIPIRILCVDDGPQTLQELKGELERSGGFEVIWATTCSAGMLSLARSRPDVLVLNPYSGRGSVEEWRRAVERYRAARPLGLVALAGRIPARDRAPLREMADLGIFASGASAERIRSLLIRWADPESLLAGAR